MIVYSCTEAVVNNSWLNTILPATISGFIVIALFLVGRRYDAKLRLKSIQREWYMSVIILPNLKKVEDFPKFICTELKESIGILSSSKDSTSHNKYIELKSIEIGKFQSIKREFEFDFIQLVRTHYHDNAIALNELLGDLEDVITKLLDDDNIQDSSYHTLENKIKQFKVDLFGILYQPIQD